MKRIVFGITGASGALYAQRTIACLHEAGAEVHLVVSKPGRRLFVDELDIGKLTAETLVGKPSDRIVFHPLDDIGALPASGSFRTDGMVICPCSSHTLAAVAAGLGESLLHRAAAVTLKERRRLILVTREMPMSHIDLLNALRLSEAGATICPASPGFYMRPQSVDDLVDFVAGKVLDLLDVPHALPVRWEDQLASDGGAT